MTVSLKDALCIDQIDNMFPQLPCPFVRLNDPVNSCAEVREFKSSCDAIAWDLVGQSGDPLSLISDLIVQSYTGLSVTRLDSLVDSCAFLT